MELFHRSIHLHVYIYYTLINRHTKKPKNLFLTGKYRFPLISYPRLCLFTVTCSIMCIKLNSRCTSAIVVAYWIFLFYKINQRWDIWTCDLFRHWENKFLRKILSFIFLKNRRTWSDGWSRKCRPSQGMQYASVHWVCPLPHSVGASLCLDVP